MIKIWHDEAWDDYLYWQKQDKKTLKRINQLIQDTERNSFKGIGKPEPLKGTLSGWWSRRIDDANRLIYRIHDNRLEIAQCVPITVINKYKYTAAYRNDRWLFLCAKILWSAEIIFVLPLDI